MKVRTLRARLYRIGCSPVRQRGSHEIWRTPKRATLVLKVNHLGAEVSRTVLSSCRRILAAEGRTLEDDGELPPQQERGRERRGSQREERVNSRRNGPPYIAVEGLDGSGKSTVARLLARRIGAVLLKNPPERLAVERIAADALPEDERRNWYANANRVADEGAMRHRAAGHAVVMDRCSASTLAFGAAHAGAVARPEGWPADVAHADLMILLDVPESVRLRRLASRATTETEEEARLRTDDSFRERVLAGYAALGATVVPAEGAPGEIVDRIVRLLGKGVTS